MESKTLSEQKEKTGSAPMFDATSSYTLKTTDEYCIRIKSDSQ